MATKAELRRAWLVWLNGLIHAGYTALGTALGSAMLLFPAHGFGWITDSTLWVSMGFSVGSGIANGVIGYMKRSPIPDVFAFNPATQQFESPTKILVEDRDTGDLVSTPKGGQS